MLHLDLNHHTPKQNLILPTTTPDHHKIISWSNQSFQQDLSYSPTVIQPDIAPSTTAHSAPSRPGPITPVDADGPLHPSGPSSPASPADGNSASPTRDRSSSLSPVPDNAVSPNISAAPMKEESSAENSKFDQASRQSTPLSELSPPPDQDGTAEPDTDAQQSLDDQPTSTLKREEVVEKTLSDTQEVTNATLIPEKSNPGQDPPSGHNVDASTLAQSSVQVMPSITTPPHRAPSNSRSTASPALTDSKVVTILELNAELLKVSIEFQTRGIPMSESRFQQFATRLQSNLTWLAVAADQSRQGSHSNISLPPMDPPPLVDFASTERIQQLYAELPALFANEIARRQQTTVLNNKRDRSDEVGSDGSRKRRDTGESKSSSMPPPAAPSLPISSPAQSHFSIPLSNSSPIGGVPLASSQLPSPSMSLPSLPSGPTEAQVAASNRERVRQLQIRQAIQQQQQQQHHQATRPMSPLASGSGPAAQQQQVPGQGQQNSVTDPSAMSNPNVAAALAALGPNAAQNFQLLQNPSHPFIQYMTTTVPGFLSLTVQQQLQRMQFVQAAIQARSQQQQQQQNQPTAGSVQQRGGGSSMTNLPSNSSLQNSGNSQYSGQSATPGSPALHQAPMTGHQLHGQSQNPMFPLGNQGRDNSVADPRLGVSNINTQSLPNGVNLNNLNPQQRHIFLQHQQQLMSGRPTNPQQAFAFQERIRQEQQQRAQAHQSGSPSNDSFPALRSNSAIPGISRSTRSPSESAPSPVTPRAITRGPSQGQEDYQRMLQVQQQQQQQQRGQSMPFHQQMQQTSNWPQQQQQQQGQSMQMGSGQGSSYGMSPPGSAGLGIPYGAPSPTNSQTNWSQGPSGRYPYSPPPGGGHQSDRVHTPRHMSSTPGPQQMHSQSISPPAEQPVLNDFDIFNWTQ